MQSRIIVGSIQAQNDYISSLIGELSIPSYAITVVEGVIKIEDVHRVVRMSKVHVGKGEKRLSVFNGIPTIPAQNALLKYLEELPESDYVIFSVTSGDMLLETIRSRCSLVVLQTETQEMPRIFSESLSTLLSAPDGTKELFHLAQKITNSEEYSQLIRELREVILERIMSNNSVSPKHITLLQYLNTLNQYVQENNVNPKFTIESFDALM